MMLCRETFWNSRCIVWAFSPEIPLFLLPFLDTKNSTGYDYSSLTYGQLVTTSFYCSYHRVLTEIENHYNFSLYKKTKTKRNATQKAPCLYNFSCRLRTTNQILKRRARAGPARSTYQAHILPPRPRLPPHRTRARPTRNDRFFKRWLTQYYDDWLPHDDPALWPCSDRSLHRPLGRKLLSPEAE